MPVVRIVRAWSTDVQDHPGPYGRGRLQSGCQFAISLLFRMIRVIVFAMLPTLHKRCCEQGCFRKRVIRDERVYLLPAICLNDKEAAGHVLVFRTGTGTER